MSWTDIAVLICYYSSLMALAVYGSHRLIIVALYYRHRHRVPHACGPLHPLPHVTVQLPIYNERYVVKRLIEAVSRIEYPRELLEIQVLDDSTDDTRAIAASAVEEYRQRGFDISLIVRAGRHGFKAGALENGMRSAKGEFLLILDADFVPHPAILTESLPYFSDPAVGMVQSRWDHLNRDFSLMTKIQAMFLDGHFVIEHTARHRSGRFFNFNGTAGIWRRETIAESGGWNSDTLTEDLELSYRAQLRGWKFVFLKDLVSPAELPVDVNGFKTQQHRWAKGSVQTGLKLLPMVFRSRLPLKVKIEAFFHLTNNLSYPLMIFLSFFIYPAMVIRHRAGWGTLIALDAVLFLVSTLSVLVFYVVSQKEIGRDWKRQVRYLPMLMSLGIGLAVNNAHAVLQALAGTPTEFVRTPKYSVERPSTRWRQKAYQLRVPWSFVVEAAFTAYFGIAVTLCVVQHLYLALPFLLLFFNGYLYMVLLTVMQRLPRHRDENALLQPLTDAD